MKILAIDPGQEKSGWCIVTTDPLQIADFGVDDNGIIETVIELSDDIDCLAIEWIQGMGMTVAASVFETCYWAGIFAAASNSETRLIPRGQIKMQHCGSTRAKDANIIQSLKDKYGEKGTKGDPGFFYGISSHVWQSFAVAAYVIEGAKSDKEIIRHSRKEKQ